MQHLEQLWLSYNSISSCNGVEKCKKLRILYLGNNKISDLKAKLRLYTNPNPAGPFVAGTPSFLWLARLFASVLRTRIEAIAL